jgi:hypothetical protein
MNTNYNIQELIFDYLNNDNKMKLINSTIIHFEIYLPFINKIYNEKNEQNKSCINICKSMEPIIEHIDDIILCNGCHTYHLTDCYFECDLGSCQFGSGKRCSDCFKFFCVNCQNSSENTSTYYSCEICGDTYCDDCDRMYNCIQCGGVFDDNCVTFINDNIHCNNCVQ